MTLQEAQRRLLAHVRDRIHNGEWTERGFARLIGVSQPHVHNVLKGVRKLSPGILDSVLRYLNLSLLDLAALQELEANLKKRRPPEPVFEAPFLDSPIGPGRSWPAAINPRRRFPLPFRITTIPRGLVMAQLVADPSMYATLTGYDIATLDTSESQRSDVSPEGLYVVSRQGEAVLRRIRPGAQCYYLLTDLVANNPAHWEKIAVTRIELSEIVKARVLWLVRGG